MKTTNLTVFPNGLNIRIVMKAGGTAGSHTFASSFGITAGDVVGSVLRVPIGTNGLVGTCADLTTEFASPVAAANTLVNTSGTNTTGSLLMAVLYCQR